jgi:ABC-type transport system involved in multi-copper enzyme maturation permease subunit
MSSTYNTAGDDTDAAKQLRLAATVVGAVFVLVGILGFVPGITSNYDDLSFAGYESDAKLLGIFQVSVLHNVVHLLFGLAGLAMARQARTAATYLIGGGVIYLVLFVYGLVIDLKSDANFVPLNDADNWLHLVLGIGMVGIGYALSRRLRDDTGAARTA